MQPLQKASLQVQTDLNALSHVLAWFDQFNAPPLAYPIWLQCQLALAEGFTNAVRHAHKGRAIEVAIDLEVMLFAERIELRIWDYGDPFNLTHMLKTLPPTIDSDAEGGRGLKLMEKIIDSLSYTRSDRRNCLLIIKYYNTLDATAPHSREEN